MLTSAVFSIFVATVAFSHEKRDKYSTYTGLVLFGFISGLAYCSRLWSINAPDSYSMAYMRAFLDLLAYFCLLWYMARGVYEKKADRVLIPSAIAFFALCMSVFQFGPVKLATVSSMLIGIPAYTTAGLYFLKSAYRDNEKLKATALFVAGTLFMLCVLLLLKRPSGALYVLHSVNTDTFEALTSVNPEFVNMCLMGVLAISLWLHTRSEIVQSDTSGLDYVLRPGDLWCPVMVIVVTAGGWWLSGLYSKQAIDSERQEFLTQIRIVSSSINPDRVSPLKGTQADVLTEDYEVVKKQLRKVRDANPDCRYVYITKILDGNVIYVVDSETETSPLHTETGRVYYSAPDFLTSAIQSGRYSVSDPYTNRSGTWVSAFGPVTGHDQKSIAAIAIDFNARDYVTDIFNRKLLPVSCTGLICMLFFSFYYFQQRYANSKRRLLISERLYRNLVEGTPNVVCLLDSEGRVVTINKFGLILMDWTEQAVTGTKLCRLWDTQHEQRLCEAVSESIRGKRVSLEITVKGKHGVDSVLSIILNPITEEVAGAANIVCVITDISGERRHGAMVRRQRDLLSAINTIFLEAANCRNISELAQVTLAQAEKLTDSEFGFINEINPDGVLESLAVTGIAGKSMIIAEKMARETDLNPRSGFAGRILLSGKGEFFDEAHASDPATLPMPGYAAVKSFLGVPVMSEGKAIGILGLANKTGGYSRTDLEAIESVSTAFVESYSRKTAEIARIDSERRFRTLFNSMLDAFALHEIKCDSDGRPVDYVFLEVNPAFEQITGLKAAEIVGKSVLSVLPATESFWIETYGQVALTGKAVRFENYSAGLAKYFEVIAYCPDHGKFATIFQDVTQRKKSEEIFNAILKGTASETGEDFFRSLVQSLATSLKVKYAYVSSFTGDGTLQTLAFWNGTDFSRNFEYGIDFTPCEKVIEQGIFHCPSGLLEAFPEDMLIGELNADSFLGTLVRDSSGKVLGVTAVMDVTSIADEADIKNIMTIFAARAGAEIARKKAQSEHVSLEAQLRQSQKMEAVGQFAGGVAHDFNNMLSVIMGYTNMLLVDSDENMPNHSIYEAMLEAANRARDLTMKLLAFSRNEKIELRKKTADSILTRIISMLERTIQKKIVIEHHLVPGILIKVDENQIFQAILNICNNARDAMPDGGQMVIECKKVMLEFSYCKKYPDLIPGDYCLIRVSDSGKGILPDEITKIFDPFFTTKKAGEGTGLGLSVTHGIIRNHGGHINVYSELGKGTVMNVYLPIASESDAADVRSLPPRIQPVTGNETILVVDDEQGILDIAEIMLKKAGYRVIKSNSGKQAIEVFRTYVSDISLVVLDMVMPDMDGSDVYATLREIAPEVNVILATGYSINGHAAQLLKDGISGFVQKPFMMQELCEEIRRVLDR